MAAWAVLCHMPSCYSHVSQTFYSLHTSIFMFKMSVKCLHCRALFCFAVGCDHKWSDEKC